MPTRAIGINGVTECPVLSKMPSNDILRTNAVIHLQQSVYSFGGKMDGDSSPGSDAVYKYSIDLDTWTQMPSLNQGRYAVAASILSEKEIFITGRS